MADNVPVPHSAPLPFSLTEGKEIIVSGTAGHGDGFSINLCEGPDLNSQTAFHFNPRFSQNEVVRAHNSGGWGAEEKDGGFPFYQGSAYEVKIVVQGHAYQVFVNNNLFCEFNHRLPKEIVRYLYITGDTSVQRIGYGNIPVPFTTPIPGGLYPGKMVFVSGVVNEGAERFSVNFVCGPDFNSNDVALHMDNRFTFGESNTVCRAVKVGGDWGSEESHQPYFPFAPGAPFEIIILVEESGYKISINNQHFTEYSHKLPFQSADHFYVMGDCKLTQVRFQ